nr:MAG TPA: hypothetical protein [Caudoviricetes sp.]
MADVPAKLNYNESIRRIPEKVNEILDYLRRTRIQVDSRTLRKNETPAGITLSAQRQTVATPAQQLPQEPAGEYAGYFKVVNASEYDENGNLTAAKVRVVNGAASEPDQEHDAGFVSAYGKNYAVKAKTLDVEEGAATDSLVYLRFINVDSEDEATEFVCSKTPLADDGLNDLLLLARVAKDMKDIQQNEFSNDAAKIGSDYRGAFAIAPAGAGRWRITAGETDLGAVPEKLVELASGSIFLIAQYSTDYTLTISTAKPDGDFGFFVLASVKNNVVTEAWNSGTAYFGERYWI